MPKRFATTVQRATAENRVRPTAFRSCPLNCGVRDCAIRDPAGNLLRVQQRR
jgi:hypothetical protein